MHNDPWLFGSPQYLTGGDMLGMADLTSHPSFCQFCILFKCNMRAGAVSRVLPTDEAQLDPQRFPCQWWLGLSKRV